MADRFTPVGPETDERAVDTQKPALLHRLLWFILIATASVVAVGAVAYALRALLFVG